MSSSPEEAIAIYQDVLDEAGLDTVDGRLVHSFAYNNLGAACQDAGRLEQSLQHLQSAVSLNKNCYLAIRNRANVHMHLATNLQKTAQPSLLPPQQGRGRQPCRRRTGCSQGRNDQQGQHGLTGRCTCC